MALISSSYTLPPGINGAVLPITVPPQLPYTTAGTPWMRVPLHFPGFAPASLSAASAYLSSSSSPRARRLSETEIHTSYFSKRLAFSPPPTRRRRVTNFSIEGILGKQETEPQSDEDEDMKVLVVDTNSEPLSPGGLSISDKDEKTIGSPLSDHHHQHHHEGVDHSDHPRDSDNNPMTRFSWLQCTRYKPPRLPRAKRKEGAKKRKLGRNPRVPFSPAQVATLEQKFRCTHYLSSIDVAELSSALNLSENRVKIWFQNRRARERRDKEAADKGELSSSIRPPTSSLTSSIPSMGLPTSSAAPSVIVSTSPSMLGLSAIPRIPSSPVDLSAFTPVSYDLKSAAAAAATAAALSSMNSHPSPS